MEKPTEIYESNDNKLDPDKTIADLDKEIADLADATGPLCSKWTKIMKKYRAYAEEVKSLRAKNLELVLTNEALQDKVDLADEPFSMTLEECEAEIGAFVLGSYAIGSAEFGGPESTRLADARLAVQCKRSTVANELAPDPNVETIHMNVIRLNNPRFDGSSWSCPACGTQMTLVPPKGGKGDE